MVFSLRPLAPSAVNPFRHPEVSPVPDRTFVLGLDVGTQSLRAAIVDLSGATAAYSVCPIDTRYPRPSWAEQDPARWWSAAAEATRSALAAGGVRAEEVVGIGLDCTACTVVACGPDGEAFYPA